MSLAIVISFCVTGLALALTIVALKDLEVRRPFMGFGLVLIEPGAFKEPGRTYKNIAIGLYLLAIAISIYGTN